MIQLNNHKEKSHKENKCFTCGEIFASRESFRDHMKKHQAEGRVSYYPGYVKHFHCDDCKESFKSHDYWMNHLSKVHLTEAQRQGAGLAKYGGSRAESNGNQWDTGIAVCRNGSGCWFYQQYRCRFFHPQSQQEVQRHIRQAPSDQWQQMPTRRPHFQQGQQYQRPHEEQSQGHKYWSLPPQGNVSAQWCLHGQGCPMGKYCVLQHEDFPNMSGQGGQ